MSDPTRAKFHGVEFDQKVELGGVGKTLGLDGPNGRPNAQHTLRDWNGLGGLWEDGFADMKEATRWAGRRAVNHFHDPLASSGGYTGFTPNISTGAAFIDVLRGGISVSEWAMNGTSTPYFDGALSVKLRESSLAAAFRALGQVQHLVEDNTVPDHARDLAHPGDGFEEYVGTHRSVLFGATPRPWVEFPVTRCSSGLR